MIKTELVESYNSLAAVMEAGLIQPVYVGPIAAQWKPPHIDPTVVAVAATLPTTSLHRLDTTRDQWSDPARDTRAQDYQDVGYEWIDSDGLPNSVYEIARFIATEDQVGIVKYCGTFVEVDNPDPPPSYVQFDPRDPHAWQRLAINIKFILRLNQGTFEPLGPQWSGPITALHGYGYGPLPHWKDYRFQWGRTANDVWWLVPANHSLRLYCQLINAEGPPVVSLLGRMLGFTQPIYTQPAVWNVSHGW